MTSFYRGWVPRLSFHNFRGDFFGGLTAAIVALPLALAFGVASGAGPSAGLYGAIAIGFLAALFGGTPSQVSGPTGPMTVLMASVFATLIARNPDSGLALAFTVVVLGGLLQMAMGALRLGKYITLIPYTVISGFMSGVGVIIILLQIGPLLGHGSAGGVVNALQQIPTWITTLNPAAAILGGLTLAIVFVVPPPPQPHSARPPNRPGGGDVDFGRRFPRQRPAPHWRNSSWAAPPALAPVHLGQP
jgi:SulP family sulfate permease